MITIIKITEKISKILFAIIFALAFSSVAFVSANDVEDSYLDEDDSLYKYNALENRISFIELQSSAYSPLEQGVDESEEGIREEWKDITQKHNFSIGEIHKAMSALEDRNEMKTFLVGNNLAVLRFQLVQIKEIATLLAVLSAKTESETIKIQIDNQVKFLKEEQKKVEEFILEQKDEFSLFGWFTNML